MDLKCSANVYTKTEMDANGMMVEEDRVVVTDNEGKLQNIKLQSKAEMFTDNGRFLKQECRRERSIIYRM